MGRAALVGSMSVPQGWTQAAPEIRTLAAALPTNLAAAAPRRQWPARAASSARWRRRAWPDAPSPLVATHSVSSGAGVGSFGGVVAEADPAAATIIVIPALED